MKHSSWAGLAFIVIILMAVGLEIFASLLLWIGFIKPDATLIHFGAPALAVMDVLFSICVVGKTGWRFLRSL